MDIRGLESRAVSFNPFLNGNAPALNYFKGSVGHLANFNLAFNHELTFFAEPGEVITVYNLGNNVWRFELPYDSEEFENMFKIGDYVAVDHSNNWWNYEGTVRFVSNNAIELNVSVFGFGGGQNREGTYSGNGILFSNYAIPQLVEFRYSLNGSDSRDLTNLFDGGQQIYIADYSQGFGAVGMTKGSGSVKNWSRSNNPPAFSLPQRIKKPQIAGVFPERTLVNVFNMNGIDIVVPFWSEDWEDNFNEGTIPDIFKGEQG